MFLCPSDSADQLNLKVGAPNSYHANQGSGILWSAFPLPADDANYGLQPPQDGVILRNIRVGAKDIIDGLSQTAAFSERIMGDGSNEVSTPESDTYQPGTWPTTADEALQDCLAIDVNDLSKQRVSDGSARFVSDSVERSTWQAIGSRNGEEIIATDF